MKHELSPILCACLALAAIRCGGGDSSTSTDTPQTGDSAKGGSAGSGASSASTSLSGSAAAAGATSTTAATSTAGDTWDSYGQGFFVTYCVSCHNDDNTGDATRNFHERSVVDAQASEIACGVSKSTADWTARGCSGFPPARQFPIGGGPKPSDSDRDRLVAWIDAALP